MITQPAGKTCPILRIPDAQAHSASGSAHSLAHLVGVLQKLAAFAEQSFAGGREPDRMRLPLQQALADLILQRLDLAAQGGLRQEDLLRGAADVALLSHRHEVTQLS